METISLAILLFIVIDPFGNLVPINSLLTKTDPSVRRKVILRESAIATGILLLASFAGGWLLGILGLQQHSLSISGGIVLFLIALGMLFPSRNLLDEESDGLPLIVPIAMPLIAGPSAISMVILFSHKYPRIEVVSAIVIASVASAALLSASAAIYRFLGKRGANALERLMGMLLIMIAIQMILNGLDAYLLSRN